MPVLLQQESLENDSNSNTGSLLAVGGGLALLILLAAVALALPITLTVFAAKRNQKGTKFYAWMCGFLVLMWCSGIILTPINKGLGGVGGFAGFVGTCVMIHKGGGCGGGGCKLDKSSEEMLRSLMTSVSGSSMTSF